MLWTSLILTKITFICKIMSHWKFLYDIKCILSPTCLFLSQMYQSIIFTCLLFGSVISSEIQCSSADIFGIDMSQVQTAEQRVQAVIGFWTDERLKAAKPKPFIRVDSLFSNKDNKQQPVTIKSTTARSSKKVQSYKYPTTVGKVFFVDTGLYYQCSASVVTSDNKDLLFTAGHCIYSTKSSKYVQNLIFIPQYTNGVRPYGTWAARCLSALSGWIMNNNHDYDVGIVLLDTLNNRHIQDVVGGQGVGFNHGHTATIYAFGYPTNYYDGQLMTNCTGTEASAGIPNYAGDSLACNMTNGASGGPWFESYDTSTLTGVQTSVNSFIMPNRPNYIFGPHFDSMIQQLYESVRTENATCPPLPSHANNNIFSSTILFTLVCLQYLHVCLMKSKYTT